MNKFLISCLFIWPLLAPAQINDLSDDLRQKIQQRVDDGVNTSIVIGVIDAAVPRYYSFGEQEAGGEKADEHTLYEIGSISKVFTGILLADQIGHKKMKADDPIADYLPAEVKVPEYSGGGPVITLGTLSDHTSALPRLPSNLDPADPGNPYADYTVEMLYDFLSNYELPREVGSAYEYSNLAAGLLGVILADQAGTTYEELMKEKITGPLGMKETAISLTDAMKKKFATGYSFGMEVESWDMPTLAGAGAIRSTTSDMLKFLAANMGLQKTKLSKAMDLSHQPRHNKAALGSVGLGWFIIEGSKGNIISHGGATGGYRAFAGFVKETGKGVVVMTNSDQDVGAIGMHLLDPEVEVSEVKPSITLRFKEIIDAEGHEGLFEKYQQLKKDGHYAIEESQINALGYYYMGEGQLDAAIEIFRINIDAFPKAFNVYDSYGEALIEKGIANYKKSLEINPANTNAIEVLGELGEEVEIVKVEVDEEILESYVGTYQIAPGFNIVISRDGGKLLGQATGQPSFELHAKSNTEFYLTVVDAQIVFSRNDEGNMMLTLYQGGQVLPGKRL